MYSAERHFVTTAHMQLRLMASEGVGETKIFDDAIEKIKQAATPVQARAVYRAALLCEDVLGRCGSTANCNFRTALARLKSLVDLYANGLYEIDPEFNFAANGKTAQPVQKDNEVISAAQQKDQLKAANQNAAETLKPLLRLVKDGEPRDALHFLIGNDDQPNRVPKTQNLQIQFDRLMRQVTNYTLGEARAKGKNISISYAADFETIDADITPDIQKILQTLCVDIVRNGLVIDGDLTASMAQNWQISLTGNVARRTSGQDLTFTLNWRGQTLSGLSTRVQQPGVQITQNTEQKNSGLDEQALTLIYPVKKPQTPAAAILPKQAEVREA